MIININVVLNIRLVSSQLYFYVSIVNYSGEVAGASLFFFMETFQESSQKKINIEYIGFLVESFFDLWSFNPN